MQNNEQGEPRKMGVEIEFSGLTIERIVSLVVMCYGGTPESESDYKKYIRHTRLGDFTVELEDLRKAIYRTRQDMTQVRSQRRLFDELVRCAILHRERKQQDL